MCKTPQKKAFNFYRSYYDTLNMLTDKQYVAFNKALTSVMFFDAHIDDINFKDQTLQILWASFSHSIRQSIDGFLSKNNIEYNQALSHPTQGCWQGGCEPPCQQEEEKEQVEGKEKEKVEEQEKGQYVIADIFHHWQSVMKKTKSRLTDDRKKIIKKALSYGYPLEHINLAITGCSMSEWNMGANDRQTPYNDLHIILKDAKNIEKFMDIADRGGAKAGKGAELDSISQRAIDEFVGNSNIVKGEVIYD